MLSGLRAVSDLTSDSIPNLEAAPLHSGSEGGAIPNITYKFHNVAGIDIYIVYNSVVAAR